MRGTAKRAGFTLIELMVVMGLIALISATVMLVAPSILDKDRARDAASQLQGALQNARLRAMRDGVPRGVRLILDTDEQTAGPVLPTAAAPSPNLFFKSSSYQYIEVPPWLLLTNLSGATAANGRLPPTLTIQNNLSTKSTTVNGVVYPIGSVISRTCTIANLTAGQKNQLTTIVNGTATTLATLGLPTINMWSQIEPGTLVSKGPTAGTYTCTMQLTVYPDAMLGTATLWSTEAGFTGPAYFGIYQAPRPLLGEPIIQMPLNTCVDLSDGVSQPSLSGYYATLLQAKTPGALVGYDLLFSPSGQLMTPTGVSQVYLWVRDPTKGIPTPGLPANRPNNQPGPPFCSLCPSAPTLGSYSYGKFANAYATGSTPGEPYNTALTQGGEQLLVSIKANSGGTGVSPVFWPNAQNPTPYYYAIGAANSP